jgi:hypothetical protein
MSTNTADASPRTAIATRAALPNGWAASSSMVVMVEAVIVPDMSASIEIPLS